MEKVIKKIIKSMGTINEIDLYYNENRQKEGIKVLDDIENYLENIDRNWSTFRNDSEVSLINNNSGLRKTKVNKDTFEIIKLSKIYAKLTNGTFDITIYPLTLIWKNCLKNKTIPKEIDVHLKKVNYNDIVLNEKEQSVMLKKKDEKIDLGGIAKGYVLDVIIKILKDNNFCNALIDLGGTITSIGKERTIGIRNPFTSIKNNNSNIFAKTNIKDECIVTSGIYEQSFIKKGKVYHHIINPKTGYPTETGIISVTLIGKNASKLDAIATAAFSLGLDKTSELINQEKIKGLIVLENGNIYITDDLKGHIELI